jgi:putative tricarboxylic transport membrane protein
MKNVEHAPAKEGAVVQRSAVEYGCALGFLVVGAVIMWDSYQTGAGWGDAGPESGYFPFRIGIILCISALAVMLETWRDKVFATEPFVTHSQLKPVLQVLVPLICYIGVVQFMGMYVGSFVLIACFMHFLGKYGWLRSVLVGSSVTVAVFWLFEIQFMVPLIKGPLEAAFGY